MNLLGIQLPPEHLWAMATAALCCVACGTIGCFLVLRGISMLGDAISHAILPGIAAAFMITGSRGLPAMLIGALIVGVLTAALSGLLSRSSAGRAAKVPADASMAVVFSTLFALGVIMITWAARDVDLDPGCVLYGLLEFTTFDRTQVFGLSIPRAALWLAIILLINSSLIALFYKELKLVSFDAALATSMGINAGLVHYGLLIAVAATTVASFEAVGSILVVAMLVAPGATAHLLTDRLGRTLGLAALLAASAAVIGYLLAIRLNASAAGLISVVAGAQFMAAVLFAPRYGVASKVFHRAMLMLRIKREDVLANLFRAAESASDAAQPTADLAASPLILRSLRATGHIEPRAGATPERSAAARFRLTAKGDAYARRLIRSHRLWEGFLTEQVGLPPDHVHEPSHRVEHFLSPAITAKLGREVPAPTDPHGRPIPPEHP